MRKVDYIIVGCGLSGLAFCEVLRKHKKSFVVFNDKSQQSSIVAGGLFNPVVLKRFTLAWKAKELLNELTAFYTEIERYLNISVLTQSTIFRIFNSVEEQNNWFAASDKPLLSTFISDDIVENTNTNIHADFGLGEVFHTGKINTAGLIDAYIKKLKELNAYFEASFDYNALIIKAQCVKYGDIEARHIVFADGFGLKTNPYFNYLPLVGSKGEYIFIQSPELKLDAILKGSVFIIPLEEDTYLVGATYNNHDKTNLPTEEARQELIIKLQKMLRCDFKVINHVAGIRPTVKDRRPLVGRHPEHKRLSLINGLGTRGVMASPFLARQLYSHLEHGEDLDSEIDIKRFEKLFLS